MPQPTVTQGQLSSRGQQLDHYLLHQMRKASAQVRLVDLFTSLMTLLAGTLGSLFLIALVDAWVLELAPWMRWGALLAIVLGVIAWIVLVIVPLTIRKINPVYAASVVESARPEIKNSLINYLLLRSEQRPASRRVVELVGARAANDISGMEVANTVDKSSTIRIAIVLTAIVVGLGSYKILSPKDPFQTFVRVLAPATDVARPARIRITDVQPGNTSAFFGQPLTVTARIAGRIGTAPVSLVYSTDNGQLVNQQIAMKPSASGNGVYTTLLKTDERGVGHSLVYYITAGDGRSGDYAVELKSTPMLTVDSITYQPPAYTRMPEQTVTGTREIQAIEGTTVLLEAVANTPIQSAVLELLQKQTGEQFKIVHTVSMEKLDDTRARCRFRLQLDGNRQTARYSHYRLALVTADGLRGEPPETCPIRVIPDLAPEIQVVDPVAEELSVPVNSRIRFSVRARDADFELTEILVAGDSAGSRVFNQKVDLPDDTDLGNTVIARFDFWPKKVRLRAGETVLLAFAAMDNRRSSVSDKPDPNMTLTSNIVVHITEPIGNPPADDEDAEKTDNRDPKTAGKPEKTNETEGETGEGETGEGETGEGETGEGETGEGETGEGETGEGETGEGETGEGETGEGETGEGETGEGETGEGETGQGETGQGETGQGETGQGETGQGETGQGETGQGETGQGETGQGETGQGETGQGETGQGETGQSITGDANNSQAGKPNSAETNDGKGSGAETGPDSGNRRPPLSEDAHDGEIIEEIIRHRQEQQDKSGSRESSNETGGDSSADQAESGANGTNEDATESGNSSGDDQQDSSESADESAGSESGSEPSQSTGSGSESEEEKSGSEGAPAGDQQPAGGGEQSDKKTKGGGSENGQETGSADSQSSQEQGAKPGETDASQTGSGKSGNDKNGEAAQPETSGDGNSDSQAQGSADANQPGEESAQGNAAADKSTSEGQTSGNKDENSQSGEGQSGEGQSGDSAAGRGNQGDLPGSESSAGNAGDAAGQGGTGNSPPGQAPRGSSGSGESSPEEAANLEFTKKTTDLALDYLSQQQVNPDPELLERLNWTEDDLRDFLDRWNTLKRQGQLGTAEQRKDWESTLKSLGLTPPDSTMRAANNRRDNQSGNVEEGRVTPVPPGFRAFQRRRNRVDNGEPPR